MAQPSEHWHHHDLWSRETRPSGQRGQCRPVVSGVKCTTGGAQCPVEHWQSLVQATPTLSLVTHAPPAHRFPRLQALGSQSPVQLV
jgi:hypothetical protein